MNALTPTTAQSDFQRHALAALEKFNAVARQRIAEMDPGSPQWDSARVDAAREFARVWRNAFALDVDELLSAIIESADDATGVLSVLSRDARKNCRHIVSDAGVEHLFQNGAADLLASERAA